MKEKFLSLIISIVLVSILMLFIPNGKSWNIIKTVLSSLILMVSFNFILSFKNLQYNFESVFDKQDVEVQTDFLFEIRNKYKNSVINNTVEMLDSLGVKNANIFVKLKDDVNRFPSVKFIEINLSDSVIISNKEHILIIEEITSNLCKNYGLDKKDVVVYE